jgi:hypothetical protein
LDERLEARMIANGALVFLVGLLAGFPFAFFELGKIVLWPIPGAISVSLPGDVRGWRMAHMEGILNGLTLIAVAAVMPKLRLSHGQRATVGWLLIVTAWGNAVASVIGPLSGGRGLEFGGAANSVMYLLFVAAVVAVIVAMWLVFVGAVRRS